MPESVRPQVRDLFPSSGCNIRFVRVMDGFHRNEALIFHEARQRCSGGIFREKGLKPHRDIGTSLTGDRDASFGKAFRHFVPVHAYGNSLFFFNCSMDFVYEYPWLAHFDQKIEWRQPAIKDVNVRALLVKHIQGRENGLL